jgi:hypothetical protein
MAKVLVDAAAECQDVTLLLNNADVGFDAGLSLHQIYPKPKLKWR